MRELWHKGLVFVALETQLRPMRVRSCFPFPFVIYLSTDLNAFLTIWRFLNTDKVLFANLDRISLGHIHFSICPSMSDQILLLIFSYLFNRLKIILWGALSKSHPYTAPWLPLISILCIFHSDHFLVNDPWFHELISFGFGLSYEQLSSLLFLLYALFNTDAAFDFEFFGILEA